MKQFRKGQWVWWNDPAGKTSGLYQVLDPQEENNADVAEEDAAQFDDRVILIGNQAGSEAEVYAQELSTPKSLRVVFRRRTNNGTSSIIALFPDEITDEGQCLVLSYEPGHQGQASYQTVIRNSVDAKKKEYEPLLAELRGLGCAQLQINTDHEFRQNQVFEVASDLAEKECADRHRILAAQLYDKRGNLKEDYEDEYNNYFATFFAHIAILAGYEGEEPTPRFVCSICGETGVACDTRINPNTEELLRKHLKREV